MKENRVHKRIIFYVALYSSLAVISIVFITTSFIIKNTELQKLTATLLILWLPLIFATVLTHLPQTIAGNLFMYMKIADTEKRREKFLTYTSGDFCKSNEFDELVTSPDYTKIKTVKVCKEKKEKGDKTHYFTVVLRNGFSYKVAVVKRDKRREGRYTTTYVVDSISQSGAIVKQTKPAQLGGVESVTIQTPVDTADASISSDTLQNNSSIAEQLQSMETSQQLAARVADNLQSPQDTIVEATETAQSLQATAVAVTGTATTEPPSQKKVAVNVPKKTYPQTKKKSTTKKK